MTSMVRVTTGPRDWQGGWNDPTMIFSKQQFRVQLSTALYPRCSVSVSQFPEHKYLLAAAVCWRLVPACPAAGGKQGCCWCGRLLLGPLSTIYSAQCQRGTGDLTSMHSGANIFSDIYKYFWSGDGRKILVGGGS